jgi:hypothetical protein
LPIAGGSVNEKKQLISWIHNIEWYACKKNDGKFKRIHGIVTELCFERILSKTDKSEIPENLVSGWCYRINTDAQPRDWFIVWHRCIRKHGKYPLDLRKTNRYFAKTLLQSRPSDRIFSVSFCFCNDSGENNIPSIQWQVLECKLVEGTIQRSGDQKSAQGIEKIISENIKSELPRCVSNHPREDIIKFLMGVDIATLQRIFAIRCFMNFSSFFLSDIDAICVDHDGQGKIIEFKRKSAAKGLIYRLNKLDNSEPSIDDYTREIDFLKGQHISKIYENLKENFTSLSEKKHGFYGLDSSHFKNIQICNQIGFRYQYIVWDSVKSDASSLMNPDLSPQKTPSLKSKIVTPLSFAGLSKTLPKDSGSYSKDIRFQLMLAAASFKSLG